jgi:hypothetical protein
MQNINTLKAEKTEETNNFLSALHETSKGLTTNGAQTFTRTASLLVDFYAQAGAMRENPSKALDLFKKAFAEDREKAIKILFYLRDIRGGQGERTLFRLCLQYLGETHPEVFEKIIQYVPEYGRFDDIFFDNQKCFDFFKEQLAKDFTSEKEVSLLAKWLPTINASSKNTVAKAKLFARNLGWNDRQYRVNIRDLRKKIRTVEELMSARKWDEIEYEKVPSQASRIYRHAFGKHDETRYTKYLEAVEKGEKKINAGTLYPYQIYKDVDSNYSPTLEALWKALPDYTRGKNALVVADVSGSMAGDPMAVSVSLALYFAERNKGAFKDHFITFSAKPQLQKIVGKTLEEKMQSIQSSHWGMNTDLAAMFRLIVDTAVTNKLPQEDLPETLYIISDMEFDSCCDKHTNFEHAKKMFETNGYKLPNVVFWNVNASGENLPVRENEKGVSLVSGFSPVIFAIAVENKTPYQVMIDTISSERYAVIKI